MPDKIIALSPESHADQVVKEYDEMPGLPLYGVTSFAELEELQAAEESTSRLSELTGYFQFMVSNIMCDPEITDKPAAITALTTEFTDRLGQAMKTKEKPGLLRRLAQTLTGNHDKAMTKREDGVDYPAADFAYVPDSNSPSTWKLRLSEARPGNITVAQLGRAAAALSPGGFRGNRVQLPADAVAGVKRRIRSEYQKLDVGPDEMPNSVKAGFTIWKDKAGQYRWFAVYSNNYRDEDNPPEIISEKSHRAFIDLVDAGAVDYPELWHWHIPGTAWGKADWLDYADGFAVASGYVYPGHEKEAETLSQLGDIRVSHGMPSRFIVRSKDDPTIIDFHVTTEISDLPGFAAANPLTEFAVIYGKESEMALSPEKREYLAKLGLGEDAIKEIEGNLASKAQAAAEAGRESKEVTETPPEATEPAIEATEAIETEAQPVYATTQEVATAIADVTKPVAEALAAINAQLAEMQADVKALKESDEAKIAKSAAATPRASLQELIAASILGDPSAQVDGRTSLAKAGPKQAASEAPQITNIPFLDSLMAQNQVGGVQ